MARLYTYDPKKNKQVLCGEVIGDTLFRWVKPEHFMRVVQGYGIQEIAFQEIVLKGLRRIILKEEGTDKRWEATLQDWISHSSVQDYGHGKQRFLSMKYQTSHKDPLQQQEEKESKRAEKINRQFEIRNGVAVEI